MGNVLESWQTCLALEQSSLLLILVNFLPNIFKLYYIFVIQSLQEPEISFPLYPVYYAFSTSHFLFRSLNSVLKILVCVMVN